MALFLQVAVPIVTLAMMLAVGLETRGPALAALAGHWKKTSLLLLLQWLLPITAMLLVLGRDATLPVAGALLLVAACPVGDIANFYTLLARGNLPLSLSLNAFSCVATPVAIAASIPVFRGLGWEAAWFDADVPVMFTRVALLVVAPVSLGIWLAWRHPKLPARITPALARGSGLGILLILAATLVHRWDYVRKMGWSAATDSAQFLLLSTFLALFFARALRLPVEKQSAFVLCVPTRNLGVATAILVATPGGMESLPVLAIYFLLEVPVMLGCADLFRRRKIKSMEA